ncbi:toxin B domain protein, partial [Escherichia coli EC1846]
IP